jgi:hypothetical protein
MDTELLLKRSKWEDRIMALIAHRDDFTPSELQSAVAIVAQLVTE